MTKKHFISVLPGLLLLLSALKGSAQSKPYSPYRVHDNTVYISGQIGVSPTTGKLVDSTFTAEAQQVLDNVHKLLSESGGDMTTVVNVTVYLKDIGNYEAFNQVYLQYFKAPLPARTLVAVSGLAGGAHIEVAVVANKKK